MSTLPTSQLATAAPINRHLEDSKCVLEANAIRLLDQLPPQLRLIGLRRAFPHVLNRIALHWNDSFQTQKTIQSLLIDDRGQRNGFPPDARQDIADLADYYFSARSELGCQAHEAPHNPPPTERSG